MEPNRMENREWLIKNNALQLPVRNYKKKVVINGKTTTIERSACFFLHGTKQLADFSARLM